MKLPVLIAFVILSFGALAQSKKETIVIKTHTTCNHCKVCETCGGLLEKDLYFVKGIKVVSYNEEDTTITVTYKPAAITPDEIRREIARLGFDADDVKADPKGYQKRDGCCKN
jgi:periplasmic mercuric ion binding protein